MLERMSKQYNKGIMIGEACYQCHRIGHFVCPKKDTKAMKFLPFIWDLDMKIWGALFQEKSDAII